MAEDPYLRPERQLEILEEICQAVARLHAMDPVILHRDMKPQNLILDAGGHVHLIDFEMIARSNLAAKEMKKMRSVRKKENNGK